MPLAMITGGASFMSVETAKLLIAGGWRLALSDIDADLVGKVAKELGGPPKATADRLDVTKLDDVQKYVAALLSRHGSIDALVNVAGGRRSVGASRDAFLDMTPKAWDEVLNPNLKGVMNCCYAVLPAMIKARKGVIVSVASGRGLRGVKNASIYSAAKAAVIKFSQSIAQEVGPYGVRVNTVAPGSTESRWAPDLAKNPGSTISPLGGRTRAKDVADAIVFLISDKASHITGSCMDISGGNALY